MERSTFAISIVSSHIFIFKLTLTQLPLKMSYSVWLPLPEWFVAFCSSEYDFLSLHITSYDIFDSCNILV